MDVWVLVMLFLAMTGYSEGANFCVCRGDVSQDALQKALDYACGAGADCSSIHDGGGCFQPNTVRAHCSYATNSYYQKKGQAQGSYEFNGVATVTATDPSSNGYTYPSSGGYFPLKPPIIPSPPLAFDNLFVSLIDYNMWSM
ncbi:hypothetical protein ACHQM5_020107 [Ranunculus cassubicifolius]